ncbi:MAG: hypothetical protein M9894_27230 [Planctomycetes bacterium]|nr:hypothetical protein [Planctomycetota bacterium]
MRLLTGVVLASGLLASVGLAQQVTVDLDDLRGEVAKLGPRLGAGSEWPDFVPRTPDGRPLVHLEEVTNHTSFPLDTAAITSAVREELGRFRVAFVDDDVPGAVRLRLSMHHVHTTATTARLDGSIWAEARGPNGSSGTGGSLNLAVDPGDWSWLERTGQVLSPPGVAPTWGGRPIGYVDDASFTEQEGLPELLLEGAYTRGVRLSRDGRRALTWDSPARLWDVDPATGLVVGRALLGHGGGYAAAGALHPGGRLAVVIDGEGQGLAWRVDDDGVREVQRFQARTGQRRPHVAAFVRDGRALLVGGVGDREGHVLELAVDVDADPPLTPGRPWPAPGCSASVLAPSPGGDSVVVAGWSGEGAVWDVGDAGPRRRAALGPVNAASYSADGAELVTATKDEVRLWALGLDGPQERARTPVPLTEQHEDSGVHGVLLVGDLVLAHTAGRTHAWRRDTDGGLGERRLLAPEGGMADQAALAGDVLVRAGSGGLRLARVRADGPALEPLGAPAVLTSNMMRGGHPVAVSPDGRWIATADLSLRLHRTGLAQGRAWSTLAAVVPRRTWVHALAFAPDGERLALVDEDGVEVWRVSDAGPARVARLDAAATAASFTPDGRLLLCGGRTLEVWPLDGTSEPLRLDVPDDLPLTGVGVALGRFVIGAGAAWRGRGVEPLGLRAWSLETGRPVPIDGGGLDLASVGRVAVSDADLVALEREEGLGLARVAARGDGLALTPAGAVPRAKEAHHRRGQPTFVPGGGWLLVPGLEDALDLWWVGDAPADVTRLATLRSGQRGEAPAHVATTADGGWLIGRSGFEDARAWRLLGERRVTIEGEVVRWERPVARPPGRPRVEVTVRREEDALAVEAANLGDAPAFLVRGELPTDARGLTPPATIVVGTVPPGGRVTRRLALPSAGAGAPAWTHAWSEAAPPGPEPLAGNTPAELLALAAREALALPESYLWRGNLLTAIGLALARAGDEAGALALAETLGKHEGQGVRDAVAEARADRGDVAGAEALVAAQWRDSRWRLAELRDRARLARVRAAPLEDALARATELELPAERSAAQVEVARRLADAGRPDAAREALARARESALAVRGYAPWSRAGVAVARAHHALGATDDAVALLEAVREAGARQDDPYARAFCLREAALGLAQVGLPERAAAVFDEARAAAREVPEHNRANVLAQLAAAEGAAGRPDALGSADDAREAGPFAEANSDQARYEVGLARLEQGDVAGALEAAAAVRDFEQYRRELLVRIGRRLTDEGRLDEALGVIEQVGQGSARAAATLDLARAQALAGDRDGALATARRASFLREGYRMAAWRGREAGEPFDFEDPARWPVNYEATGFVSASVIATERAAIHGLCASAMRLRLALGWVDGERFARAFDGREELARALALLHGALGDRADAEGWIERLTDPRTRAWAILGLAEGLLEGS